MTRIGLFTLVHGYNYGGLLQCYALKKVLEKEGHSVSVINFNPGQKGRKFSKLFKLLGSSLTEKIILARQYVLFGKKLVDKFNVFRRAELNLTTLLIADDLKAYCDETFDTLIVGSDQVWNLDWFVPEYFFEFSRPKNQRLISYAACFGSSSVKSELQNRIKNDLLKFDLITLRNQYSADIVNQLVGFSPEVVADPTILYDFSEFANFENLYNLPQRYMIVYALSEALFQQNYNDILALSIRHNLPIVLIKSEVLQPWVKIKGAVEMTNPSVNDWLVALKNASFVVTDSFHGSILSIKFSIPFYNYSFTTSQSNRMKDAVNRYGVSNASDFDLMMETNNLHDLFDFPSILMRMDKHKNDSIQILTTGLVNG